MKLTIKHLKGYLGTELEIQHNYEFAKHNKEKDLRPWVTILGHLFLPDENYEYKFKPLLFPLSMLTEFREDLGFVPIKYLFYNVISTDSDMYSNDINNFMEVCSEHSLDFCPFICIEKLYEWHFDIHGLIEKGLAIDKSKL